LAAVLTGDRRSWKPFNGINRHAREARLPHFSGQSAAHFARESFAAIWDDILPPTPQDVWDENLALVAHALD